MDRVEYGVWSVQADLDAQNPDKQKDWTKHWYTRFPDLDTYLQPGDKEFLAHITPNDFRLGPDTPWEFAEYIRIKRAELPRTKGDIDEELRKTAEHRAWAKRDKARRRLLNRTYILGGTSSIVLLGLSKTLASASYLLIPGIVLTAGTLLVCYTSLKQSTEDEDPTARTHFTHEELEKTKWDFWNYLYIFSLTLTLLADPFLIAFIVLAIINVDQWGIHLLISTAPAISLFIITVVTGLLNNKD